MLVPFGLLTLQMKTLMDKDVRVVEVYMFKWFVVQKALCEAAGLVGPEIFISAGSVHQKYALIPVDLCKLQRDMLMRDKERMI